MLEKVFEKKMELGLTTYQGRQESQKGRGKVLSGEEGVTRIEKCHFSACRVKMEIDGWKSLFTEVFRKKCIYFSKLKAPT